MLYDETAMLSCYAANCCHRCAVVTAYLHSYKSSLCYWQCLLDLRFSEPLDADAVPDVIDDLKLVSYSTQRPLVVLKKPCNFYRGGYYGQYSAPINSSYTSLYYALQHKQSLQCMLSAFKCPCVMIQTYKSDATLRLSEAKVAEANATNIVQLRILHVDSDEFAIPDIIVHRAHIITDDNSTGCDISFVQVSDIGDPNCDGLTTAAGIVLVQAICAVCERVHNYIILGRCYRRKLLDVRFNRSADAIAAHDDLTYLQLTSGQQTDSPK
eukprot:7563-Heterococcus_DN1.PRE.4